MRNWISLLLGTLAAGFGLGSFLIPNHFIDGGVTGVCMLLSEITHIPLGILLIVINAPFVFLGYKYFGLAFAVKSSIAILGLSIVVQTIPFPPATEDKLLGSIFGGFFVGAGVGLAIRSGGVLDGTEILAVILSKRTFATVGEVILGLNVIIFSVAAAFLGVEAALYSALTYFAASKTIDYLLHGIESYNSVMIVSAQHEAIRKSILEEMGRGVTAFQARGGFTSAEQTVLICIVTRLEITKLEDIIKLKDPSAFIVISPVHDASGGVLKRREFH